MRKDIGIVFQDSTLDAQMTVEENLKYHCSFYKVPKNEVRERIDFALDLVELTEWKRAAVGSLSGGMKRRAEIARGLVHDPKVLFLDVNCSRVKGVYPVYGDEVKGEKRTVYTKGTKRCILC